MCTCLLVLLVAVLGFCVVKIKDMYSRTRSFCIANLRHRCTKLWGTCKQFSLVVDCIHAAVVRETMSFGYWPRFVCSARTFAFYEFYIARQGVHEPISRMLMDTCVYGVLRGEGGCLDLSVKTYSTWGGCLGGRGQHRGLSCNL